MQQTKKLLIIGIKSMFRLIYLSIVLIAFNQTIFADNTIKISKPSIKEICDSTSNVVIPKTDIPTAEDMATLKDCNSGSFYYGLPFNQYDEPLNDMDKQVDVDYIKARKCALLDKSTQIQDFLSDYGVLISIYANGLEVKKNLDIAIHYACRLNSSIDNLDPNKDIESVIYYLYTQSRRVILLLINLISYYAAFFHFSSINLYS